MAAGENRTLALGFLRIVLHAIRLAPLACNHPPQREFKDPDQSMLARHAELRRLTTKSQG
jgi:hypothetical protein